MGEVYGILFLNHIFRHNTITYIMKIFLLNTAESSSMDPVPVMSNKVEDACTWMLDHSSM